MVALPPMWITRSDLSTALCGSYPQDAMMCANRYIASHPHSRHRTRVTLLLVWLYASSPVWLYTHVASVVICGLTKMRTYHMPMMPVWIYTHDASVVICERHLNANENDSHSAIMGTQPSWAHSHHGHTARAPC